MSSTISLTREEARAIIRVARGCDVFNWALAKTLRQLERYPSKPLVTISDSLGGYAATDQIPYFRCVATQHGFDAACALLMDDKEEIDHERENREIHY